MERGPALPGVGPIAHVAVDLVAAVRKLGMAAGLRDWWHQREAPLNFSIPSPDDVGPAVPAAYVPLYTYLDRRYAATVVLTFEQIEMLLGFTPPFPAFADAQWWTGPYTTNDRHAAAWTAAHRSAVPRLKARIVAFERVA